MKAKARLVRLQEPGHWAVVQNRDVDALQLSGKSAVASLYWEGQEPVHKTDAYICMGEQEAWLSYNKRITFDYRDVDLIGRHNLENLAMTASALILGGVPCSNLTKQLSDFIPLPHRCTFVAEINGVRYIDDSKGTNVAASATALTSIHGPKVVILGGQGKGGLLSPCGSGKKKARVAIVLGAEKSLSLLLLRAGFARHIEVDSMEDAVKAAMALSLPGETVLLSPACTSWDMYPSYKKRGEHFQHLVNKYGGLL